MQSIGTAVIVVTSNKNILAILRQILLPPIFDLTITTDISHAKHLINEKHYSIAIMDLLDGDDIGDAMDISDELTLLLLAVEPQKLDHISYRASAEGVITFSKTADIYGYYNIIRIAMAAVAKIDRIAIKETRLKEKMDEIQLVSRAKLHLMEERAMSETDAHHYIEKCAMDSRKKRVTVAREILESI